MAAARATPSCFLPNALCPGGAAALWSGELAPGQQLPSALTLSGEYQVSVPTVRKAIGSLKDEGLVVGVAGYGTFVAES
jgi:DNA-binding GntR family transcriptional regulator